MRRKIGITLMLAGAVAIAGALGLLLYDIYDNYRAGESITTVQDALAAAEAELQEAIENGEAELEGGARYADETGDGEAAENTGSTADSSNSASGSASGDGDSSGGTGDSQSDESDAETAMMTVTVDGHDYIGTLSIPSLGLELPIMADWDYPSLKIAPCRYQGSVWSNDLILCGHNYDRHFGKLKTLEPGDAVTFTDVLGNVFSYEVAATVILKPTALDVMADQESSDWDLTLFTCTIGGRTRVTVRCVRVEE